MRRLLLLAALVGFALPLTADDKKPAAAKVVISDPAKLADDPDYAVQGEYVGEVDLKGRKEKAGVQLIARGNGNFEFVVYQGGLPGAGGVSKSRDAGAKAVRKDGKVVVMDPLGKPTGEIADGKIVMKGEQVNGTLARVERKSPTLGAKPPAGAVVLFGGPKDADHWENGKLLTLSDGAFLAANNVRCKPELQSFTAHVEFRLAYMPGHTGQGRSNSGVYVQDRYEVQVLDSFGLKGENNECGGVYTVAAPSVNMCLPPMVWQTYDIAFTAAKFDAAVMKTEPAVLTLRHNGVVVHDKLKLKHTPGGKFNKEVPEPGALFFQNHGDPVVFNNVWVVETK